MTNAGRGTGGHRRGESWQWWETLSAGSKGEQDSDGTGDRLQVVANTEVDSEIRALDAAALDEP